jgi:hypothetical protein
MSIRPSSRCCWHPVSANSLYNASNCPWCNPHSATLWPSTLAQSTNEYATAPFHLQLIKDMQLLDTDADHKSSSDTVSAVLLELGQRALKNFEEAVKTILSMSNVYCIEHLKGCCKIKCDLKHYKIGEECPYCYMPIPTEKTQGHVGYHFRCLERDVKAYTSVDPKQLFARIADEFYRTNNAF